MASPPHRESNPPSARADASAERGKRPIGEVLRMRGARRVVIGILLLLPLSTIGYAAVGDRTASARGWQVNRLPVAPHAATSFSEPGVAAGPHGWLVENACTANSGSPSTFWRSLDDGRTWSRGFPIGSSAIGCGDS